MMRTISLQEANGLLPLVRARIGHIHQRLHHLEILHQQGPRKPEASLILDKNSKLIQISLRPELNKKRASVAKKIAHLENLISEEISMLAKLGAVVRNLFPPHVDFLSFNHGRPVYFCWHEGEEEIKHWHFIDDSSPWRQTIRLELLGPTMVH